MEKEGPLKFHGKRRYLIFPWNLGPLKFHGKRRVLKMP